MVFSRPKKAIGIDIGSQSVKAILMTRSGGRLRVEAAGFAAVDRNLMNVDPVSAQANALREALRAIPIGQCLIVGALPGQTVVIRYPRLPDMPEDEIGAALEKEAGQHIPYDLSEVFLDWALLDNVREGNEKLLKVLLVAAKHEVIDSRVQIASAADVQYGMLSVDSLALADAAEGCDFLRVGETVALVNIGISSVSIHFVKDGISNFIRDINWGARELLQAISRARHVEQDKAEKLLGDLGSKEAASAPSDEPELVTPVEDELPEAEKPAQERGSLLDPFEDELDATPAQKPAQPAAVTRTEGQGEQDLRDVLVGPLGRLVSEIRRSFDYYEHELYESPVERLILSGGIAHVPILSETLSEELGVKSVEVANPTNCALFLAEGRAVAPLMERPAQFMVAIGLAARGMAEL